ncbi:YrdB family protein [Haloarchaeobius baliensis]|uniref:YrdB family protein n=1 Tax=Haloarchaeobius baliensis TaxID=1670458 RepID=UPI003F885567
MTATASDADLDERGALAVAVLGVRFLLELGALAAVAYWGVVTAGGGLTGAALGLGLALVVAAVWGVFVSPKAPSRLDGAPRLAVEALVFGGAAVCLFATGQVALGTAFALVAVVDRALVSWLSLDSY